MESSSGRWNTNNPERVREARERHKKKRQTEKARRAALPALERAQEDVESILAGLTPRDRRALASWTVGWIDPKRGSSSR